MWTLISNSSTSMSKIAYLLTPLCGVQNQVKLIYRGRRQNGGYFWVGRGQERNLGEMKMLCVLIQMAGTWI